MASKPWLFDPVTSVRIPICLGGDLILTFKNKTPGTGTTGTDGVWVPPEYIDFPEGVTLKLAIGKGDTIIEAPGTVSGIYRVCRVESTVMDTVKDGTLWRTIVSKPNGEVEDNIPAINGILVRSDGD